MSDEPCAIGEPDPASRTQPAAVRVFGWLGRIIPAVLALGLLAGVVVAGQRSKWVLPKASALRGEGKRAADDWCETHGAPESICVECDADLLPRPPQTGWNKEFGVHDCPFDNPSIAQTAYPPRITSDDLERARRALAFAPRPPNGKTCRQHFRRIQLASGDVVARLGIGLEPVGTAPVVEGVTAPGEVVYDPTRVARLAPRVAGTVWRVEKQVGDRVRSGEVMALIEGAEVGKAKAEFQQALSQVKLRTETLAARRKLEGSVVPPQEVREAEAALEESRVRLLLAEQGLANLGMPIRADELTGLTPSDVAARLRFRGLPDTLAAEVAPLTVSNNLLAVTAPFDGEVVARAAAAGGPADPTKPLFVVADPQRVWLMLRVRFEDADRVRPAQPVRFQYADRAGTLLGTVAWVSPAADERTRTVSVRVSLSGSGSRLPSNTFGTGFVLLREETSAVVVPSAAVHWEGCCHIVFVADRGFDRPDGFKVFHVRKLRPGAKDATPAGTPITEVVAGVLPGERVAVTNSGVLRSELLKNDLGAG